MNIKNCQHLDLGPPGLSALLVQILLIYLSKMLGSITTEFQSAAVSCRLTDCTALGYRLTFLYSRFYNINDTITCPTFNRHHFVHYSTFPVYLSIIIHK